MEIPAKGVWQQEQAGENKAVPVVAMIARPF